MKIHKVVQGSPEWLELRRTTHNASEAPAMKGVSRYKTYAELVREKATGITPEITPEQQRRFDEGHAAEDAARPIAEELLGESLYPMTATDDAGYLLASSDGCTIPPKGGVGFEHKLWNENLAAQVAAGEVPESHAWQLDQQIAVFGFEKIIFVVSDGTSENFVSCEYRTTPKRIAALMAGWKQFDADAAAYVPDDTPAKPVLVAKPIDNLPALVVEITGRVTSSNLVEFKRHATDVIASINTSLQSDQDFVDAARAVKYLKDVEDKARRAKKNALEQTASIDELFTALDDVIAMAATVRKELDRKITKEKESRKTELVMSAKAELAAHVRKLGARVGGLMQDVQADFGGVIKGLSSLDSMKGKLAAALAEAKITANELADRIEGNVKSLEPDGKSWRFLFPDLNIVCAKAPDDFAALLMARVAAHQAAEEKRLVEERNRIRAEEQAKAAAEAEAKRIADAFAAQQNTPPPAASAPEPENAPVLVQRPDDQGSGIPYTAERSAPVIAIAKPARSPFIDLYDHASDLMADMTEHELALVLHYCERLIADRQATA